MFTRWEPLFALFIFSCSTIVLGQQASLPPSAAAQEFPVTFQESIVAGKTPVGTKVQAKLRMATLVHGTVIPQGAVFSGEVIESAAKTQTTPSKLALRIDSAQWKNGSATLKIYLIGWFYPFVTQSDQDSQYGPQQPSSASNGIGRASGGPGYRPFPDGGPDSHADPDASDSATSQHRVQMKNVETERDSDGTVTLVSSHSNIKLDKATTYVVANAELLARTPKSPAAK
jgi:hypothetical protein